MKKDREFGTNDSNNKREDGLRDTPLNAISSLPTKNRFSAVVLHQYILVIFVSPGPQGNH